MYMDFKKLWFWLSAIVATGGILFWIYGIQQFGFFSIDYTLFIILLTIAFVFLFIVFIKLAAKRIFPNYFLWFIFFITEAFGLLAFALLELLVISNGCSSFCGAFVILFGPPGVISLVIAIILFIKSNRLS